MATLFHLIMTIALAVSLGTGSIWPDDGLPCKGDVQVATAQPFPSGGLPRSRKTVAILRGHASVPGSRIHCHSGVVHAAVNVSSESPLPLPTLAHKRFAIRADNDPDACSPAPPLAPPRTGQRTDTAA